MSAPLFGFNWDPLLQSLLGLRDVQGRQLSILTDIRDALRTDRARPQIVFTIRLNQYNVLKGVNLMAQITDVQKIHLGPIVVLDAKGNPAKVDGVPTWASADETIITVAASADGTEADASAVGPLTADGASVQVVVSADADLGEGVTTISGTVDLTVVSSQATQIQVPTGAPTNQ